MSEAAARAVVAALTHYAAIGAVFAVAFVIFGVARVDARARSAPWTFRLAILPGSAALWPWLLVRWIGGKPARPHDEHRDHARGAG